MVPALNNVGDACVYADPAFSTGTEYSASSQHFYQYTATVTGLATVDGQAFTSGGFPTAYSIFEYKVYAAGDCDATIAQGSWASSTGSSATFDVVENASYIIAVGGYSSGMSPGLPYSFTLTEDWYPTTPSLISASGGAGGTAALDFAGVDVSPFQTLDFSNGIIPTENNVEGYLEYAQLVAEIEASISDPVQTHNAINQINNKFIFCIFNITSIHFL